MWKDFELRTGKQNGRKSKNRYHHRSFLKRNSKEFNTQELEEISSLNKRMMGTWGLLKIKSSL